MFGLILTVCLEALGLLIAVAVAAYLSKRGHKERRHVRYLISEKTELHKKLLVAESALNEEQEKKELYRRVFHRTKDMVLIHGITEGQLPGVFREVNDIACAQLSYSREDLLTMTPMDIEVTDTPLTTTGYSRSDLVVLSDDYVKDRQARIASNAARRLMRRVLEEGKVFYETTYSSHNGEKIPVAVTAQRLELGGETVVMYTAQDITEREETRRELDETRRRFQDFFSSSPIGIAMYDVDKKLVDVNPACLKMFGIPDRTEFERVDLYHGEFVPATARRRLDLGESVRYEAVVDFDAMLQQAKCITTKTGFAYFDLLMSNMGPDRDFRTRGYFAQVQDITEQRKTEASLVASEQQLRQAEKMEAIGAMAGGIAHDFNNILTPIIGYTKMLMNLLPENEKPHKYVQGIDKASQRAKSLVGQILTFSRKSDGIEEQNPPAIHVIPIVKEVLNLQQTSLPEGVEIKRIIKTERDVVKADPTKLHQVFMNLCTNAGHAMRETAGGMLELSLVDFVLEARTRNPYPELTPGRYLKVSVRDTGSGMDESTVARIFEPFFTTKKSGEGTGMGLSVVHGIIKAYRGAISVDSCRGEGSAFHVVLPVVEIEAKASAATESNPIPGGSESILVVDDAADNLEMEREMLESLGYRVTTAGSSMTAWGLFEKSPDSFDLVLTDQVMPEMSGSELAARILAIRPDVVIFLCTGHSERITESEAKALGIKEFFHKPLEIDLLARAIRKSLDAV